MTATPTLNRPLCREVRVVLVFAACHSVDTDEPDHHVTEDAQLTVTNHFGGVADAFLSFWRFRWTASPRSTRVFPFTVRCGTIVSMSSESLRTVRDRFSEFIERVHKHHERVVVTRNGSPAAVLISPEDLESLEETLAVLGDSESVAELVAAHRAYLEDDVVRGVEAVEALRPR